MMSTSDEALTINVTDPSEFTHISKKEKEKNPQMLVIIFSVIELTAYVISTFCLFFSSSLISFIALSIFFAFLLFSEFVIYSCIGDLLKKKKSYGMYTDTTVESLSKKIIDRDMHIKRLEEELYKVKEENQ